MATIEVTMKIEANESELGTLASLLLGRMMAAVAEVRSEPLALPAEPTVVKARAVKPAPAKRPAVVETVAEQPAAADDGEEESKRTSSPMPFEEFDRLVRYEMKRLSIDGNRMPGFRLWDSDRDKRLPTLSAVIKRYGKSRLGELAELFEMRPPLTVSTVRAGMGGGEQGD